MEDLCGTDEKPQPPLSNSELRVVLHRTDLKEEELGPQQQELKFPQIKKEEELDPPHIKDEQQEDEITMLPLTGVLKSESDGDHSGESPSDLLFPAPSNSSNTDTAEENGGEEVDLVADLHATPFSRRTFQEKLDIVRRGRPTPVLAKLSQLGKGYVRHFQTTNYERYPWLTASVKWCKLYCWECLLFGSDRFGVWTHTGFVNLNCFTKAATRHQMSAVHLRSVVLSKTFGDIRVNLQLSDQVRRETELHDEKVKKNREILKRLMDCVIFLGKQEFSFEKASFESPQSLKRGIYEEFVSFLAEHDPDLHYHLSTNRAFTETQGKIQNDLIYAIAEVMGDEIKMEIKNAPFVAVVVDEATNVGNSTQLALILRYVTPAGVKERFVKFVDVTSSKRADDIANIIFHFLEEYECPLDKVVAQCYNGTAVMASGLNEVQSKVKEKAPMALFIHYYAHPLHLVLTQAASKHKECKLFFASLNGLAAFFSRSLKLTQLLDEICKQRLPHLVPTQWQNTSRLVNAVFEKQIALKEFFHHILEHHDEYDEDTVLFADGFSARLEDFEFCFLLNTFEGIFGHADVLFAILQTNALNVRLCLARVNDFCRTVKEAKEKFSDIYEQTVNVLGVPAVRRGQGAAQDDLRSHYQKLHHSTLDNILSQIRKRFQDHKMLIFLSLLDPQKFNSNGEKILKATFSSLMQSHETLFDFTRLKTQLTVLYSMADFKEKNPMELLDFLRNKDLSESMSELYTLVCLAVTIPVFTASVEHSFSACERLKTYARNTTGQMRLSALASLSIEKDLLMDLKHTDKLFNRAIEVFLRKERRTDFIFSNNEVLCGSMLPSMNTILVLSTTGRSSPKLKRRRIQPHPT